MSPQIPTTFSSNKKIKIGLIYGGRSSEHEVSIASARNVYKHIDSNLFEVFCIGISYEGAWHLTPDVMRDLKNGKKLQPNLDATKSHFVCENGDIVYIDIALPILHGSYGEDGSIQGLFNIMNIPVSGSNVLGSALSMNKWMTKKILVEAGLPVVPFTHFCKERKKYIAFTKEKEALGLPLIVKASKLGSSIGVYKVGTANEFDEAIEKAFSYDNDILIEQYIDGREIECALLGNNPTQAAPPGEIVIHGTGKFYDFDAKYNDNLAVTIYHTAQLNMETIERIQTLAIKAFHALQCKDFGRLDLFLDYDNNLYINEMNTIPGFTKASLFPMMWETRGMPVQKLITHIIHLGLERFEKSSQIHDSLPPPIRLNN